MATETKARKEERKAEAIALLRRLLPPGGKVWAQVTHVSRSGMMKRVQVMIIIDGDICDVTGIVANALGDSRNDDGIRVGGCGFDAAFDVVHRLSYVLHGNEGGGKKSGPHGALYPPTAEDWTAGYSLIHMRL